MQSQATSVEAYLAALPADRREAIRAVRDVILQNLSPEYEEGMQYGMIGYFVPHTVYPAGYHCDPRQPLPFAGLASQKNHMALYLTGIYTDPELAAWLRDRWTQSGHKLDMGKGCIRFKKLADVPLKVVGQAIKRVPARKFIAQYEAQRPPTGGKRATPKSKAATPKTAPRKKATTKSDGHKKAAP